VRSRQIIDQEKLKESMFNTFSHRGTSLTAIKFDDPALKVIQRFWTAHLLDIGDCAEELNLPKDIRLVIDELNEYIATVQLKLLLKNK
ncbi:MAG TPA: hypothetical protein PKW79_04925, partial [Rhabdochlamydiaceae bacterium]|nr:hypothetical protein [Rhabdochlamydiaceae bacterium]